MVLHPGASGPEAKLEGYTRPLSDCTHFFLEFSSRDFEESSDGELLVASKYELITSMHIEKSYAGVQSNCLNISTLFFSWIPIFRRFLPRNRKSIFSC